MPCSRRTYQVLAQQESPRRSHSWPGTDFYLPAQCFEAAGSPTYRRYRENSEDGVVNQKVSYATSYLGFDLGRDRKTKIVAAGRGLLRSNECRHPRSKLGGTTH